MKKYLITMILLSLVALACNTHKNRLPEELQGRVKFETISFAPKLAGRISKIFVTEGQVVKKGDTLAVLDIPETGAKMQQAEGALIAAQGQLDLANNGATAEQVNEAESQLAGAAEQLLFAEKSFKRMSNMYKDSLIPAQQYDEARMKLEGARAQLNVISARKTAVLKGARLENIRSAMGQVERAAGAKNETLIAANEQYLLAPADMSIESVSLKEGELALAGYTLFTGIKKDAVYFRFTVNESKVNAYSIQQKVLIIVPNTAIKLSGSIVAVKQLARYADNTSTSPNSTLGEATYELKVIPDSLLVATKLYQNSTVLMQEIK